jgi:DNA invertase Pin-like site-specific DNA recombinase
VLIGYCRVSTQGQSLDAQLEQLKAAGCERIFAEKQSGAWTERPELTKLKAQVTHGDVVVVTALDRLARSTRDLLNITEELRQRGVGFKSLREAMIDTTSATGELMVQILAAIAQFERRLIRARVEDGTKRARERGVKFGPKFKLNRHQRQEVLQRLKDGESQSDVARSFAVDRSTINRLARAGEASTPA